MGLVWNWGLYRVLDPYSMATPPPMGTNVNPFWSAQARSQAADLSSMRRLRLRFEGLQPIMRWKPSVRKYSRKQKIFLRRRSSGSLAAVNRRHSSREPRGPMGVGDRVTGDGLVSQREGRGHQPRGVEGPPGLQKEGSRLEPSGGTVNEVFRNGWIHMVVCGPIDWVEV